MLLSQYQRTYQKQIKGGRAYFCLLESAVHDSRKVIAGRVEAAAPAVSIGQEEGDAAAHLALLLQS